MYNDNNEGHGEAVDCMGRRFSLGCVSIAVLHIEKSAILLWLLLSLYICTIDIYLTPKEILQCIWS